MNVNLTGMFLSCKHVMPYLVEQGGGAIINISSVPPSASIMALVSSAESSRRSTSNSFAPSCAKVMAVARPFPSRLAGTHDDGHLVLQSLAHLILLY